MVTREEASLEQVEGVALALRQHANLGEAQRRPRSLGHSLELSRMHRLHVGHVGFCQLWLLGGGRRGEWQDGLGRI